ncbi:Alpha/Beta hydrolase protein [Achaetomium macrosporum]|uniref:Carboxylic ester hydrolase n=1 Tax=Achaetomium macrosporum TaxID=79813 RepID=A0AAN7C4A9_9PEZI|nr:Alpha/Beta hydrolase protein [Achaetomium macrosporum]
MEANILRFQNAASPAAVVGDDNSNLGSVGIIFHCRNTCRNKWLATTESTQLMPFLEKSPREAPSTTSPPTATLKNGTYEGIHVASYNQDLFLGIPYAQPPVGDLRFRNPQSLNTTFGLKNATEYAASCYGYGNAKAWPYFLSEDCLTLNVVRPAGYTGDSKLPVAVWIHGGGYVMDYSANGVYNLSFIVQQSVRMDKPMIAVSFDYRLSAWGFLASDEILQAGVANLGLKDQYLALRFIKENIAAFGGDPDKITIWGESAGGGSVSYMAKAYEGRNEALFRAIIAESLYEPSHSANMTLPNMLYANLTAAVGCNATSDRLDCLRKVPADLLNSTIADIVPTTSFYPVVDGGIVPDLSSRLLAQGKFTKVPLLIGSNSDEGTSFSPSGISSDEEFTQSVRSGGPDANTTTILMTLYPDIPSVGIPTGFHSRPDSTIGTQFKRSAAYYGDYTILSQRRLRNQAWYAHGVTSFAYQFDCPAVNNPAYIGTPHFAEVAYVFNNIQGLGYYSYQNPFTNATESMFQLANLVSRMWVSFIVDLDPNNHGVPGIERWPAYNNTDGYGEEFYLHPERSGVRLDNYRLEGTTFINEVQETQYGR